MDMDMDKLAESLKKISEEIVTVTDKELNIMGQETSMLVRVLHMTAGKESPMYQNAVKLLKILEDEYDRRTVVGTQGQNLAKQRVPRTMNELLALGDGDVEGVEISIKAKKQKMKVPSTFCELMALG